MTARERLAAGARCPNGPIWSRWRLGIGTGSRQEHGQWQERPAAHRDDWIGYVLGDLLGWQGGVKFQGREAPVVIYWMAIQPGRRATASSLN